MADAGVVNLAASDLLQCSLGYSRALRDFGPPPLGGFQVGEDGFVHARLHNRYSGPIFGPCQPTFGPTREISCNPMRGKKKFPKVAGFYRHIVAQNIINLAAIHFREQRDKPRALAAATGKTGSGGISKSTMQRIMSGQTGASLDNLEAIASALDVSLYQLLIPALDAASPQVVQGATEAEEKAYKRWRRGHEIKHLPQY